MSSVLEENLSLGHLWGLVTSDIDVPTFLGKKLHLNLCNPDTSFFILASLDVAKGLPGLKPSQGDVSWPKSESTEALVGWLREPLKSWSFDLCTGETRGHRRTNLTWQLLHFPGSGLLAHDIIREAARGEHCGKVSFS